MHSFRNYAQLGKYLWVKYCKVCSRNLKISFCLFFSNHLQFLKACTNYADCFNVFSMFQKAGANRRSFVHRWMLGLWDCNNWVKKIFLLELFWGMNFVFVWHTLFKQSFLPVCLCLCPTPFFIAQLLCCGTAEFWEVSEQAVPQHPIIPRTHPNFYELIFLLLLCW